MTDLLVDRMHVRACATSAEDEVRLRSLLRDLAGRRLDEALAAVTVPEGDWCVRRVQVPLPYDATAADTAIARRWARAVAEALTAALTATAGPEVVHYPRPLAARTDLVAELALGRVERAWAWRAVGVLRTTDPDPSSAPTELAVAVLAADGSATVPALVAAVRRAGLPAVHRLLGERGWVRLAAAVLQTHGARRGSRRPVTGDGADPAQAPGPVAPSRSPARSAAADAQPTSAAVLARSTLAAACRGGRVRPAGDVARAWAVLSLAEAEPAALRRPDLDTVLELLTAALDPRAGDAARAADADRRGAVPERGGPTSPPPAEGRPHGSDDTTTPTARRRPAPPGADARSTGTGASPSAGSDVTGSDVAGSDMAAGPDAAVPTPSPGRPPSGPPPPADSGPGPTSTDLDHRATDGAPTLHPTSWGGLVYLLATAAEAGVPDAVLDDDRLGHRPASWLLLHLLRTLTGPAPDAAADPAVRALAGLPATGPLPEPVPAAGERAALLEHAVRWARVTADRLDDELAPPEVVQRIAARTGTVEQVQGWIEVHLRLDDVDLAVRRAGLDVDPGFVPWLGAVVVIRYA